MEEPTAPTEPSRKQQALVPSPEPTELARSGWAGGLGVLVPALIVVIPIPIYWQQLYWAPMRHLHRLVGYDAALALFSSVVWLAPALGGVLGAYALKRILTGFLGTDPERQRALGAGACMAGSLVILAVTLGKNLFNFEAAWVGLQLMPAALGLGVLGTIFFRSIRTREDQPGEVPALYQGLTVGGATGPALMAAMIPWTLAASVIPAVGPRALAALFGATDQATVLVAGTALALTALTPVTWFMGKLFRRIFPRGPAGMLRAGLVFPALVALVFATLTPWELGRHGLDPSLLALGAWWALGLGSQLAAAWVGGRSRSDQEERPVAGELPEGEMVSS